MEINAIAALEKLNPHQELWDDMPNFYIAGGYIRDHLLGTEPKDIDVFCSYEDIDIVLERLQVYTKRRFSLGEYGADPAVVDVRHGTSPLFDRDIDVVGMIERPKTAQDLFDRFYCSLSDVAYGHFGLTIGKQFKEDVEAGCMTVRNKPWMVQSRIDKKVRNISARYPKLVINDMRPIGL